MVRSESIDAARFTLEAFHRFRVGRECGMEHFQSYLAAKRQVSGTIDGCHATGANTPVNGVPCANLLALSEHASPFSPIGPRDAGRDLFNRISTHHTAGQYMHTKRRMQATWVPGMPQACPSLGKQIRRCVVTGAPLTVVPSLSVPRCKHAGIRSSGRSMAPRAGASHRFGGTKTSAQGTPPVTLASPVLYSGEGVNVWA